MGEESPSRAVWRRRAVYLFAALIVLPLLLGAVVIIQMVPAETDATIWIRRTNLATWSSSMLAAIPFMVLAVAYLRKPDRFGVVYWLMPAYCFAAIAGLLLGLLRHTTSDGLAALGWQDVTMFVVLGTVFGGPGAALLLTRPRQVGTPDDPLRLSPATKPALAAAIAVLCLPAAFALVDGLAIALLSPLHSAAILAFALVLLVKPERFAFAYWLLPLYLLAHGLSLIPDFMFRTLGAPPELIDDGYWATRWQSVVTNLAFLAVAVVLYRVRPRQAELEAVNG